VVWVESRSNALWTRRFFGGLLAIIGSLDIVESLIAQHPLRSQVLDSLLPAEVTFGGRTGKPEPAAVQRAVRPRVGRPLPGGFEHRVGAASADRSAPGAPAAAVARFASAPGDAAGMGAAPALVGHLKAPRRTYL